MVYTSKIITIVALTVESICQKNKGGRILSMKGNIYESIEEVHIKNKELNSHAFHRCSAELYSGVIQAWIPLLNLAATQCSALFVFGISFQWSILSV